MSAARDDLAARGISVKPLEWHPAHGCEARGMGILYAMAETTPGLFAMYSPFHSMRDLPKSDMQAAAQTDFTARILAALDATPEALADHPAVRALVEAERERIIASLKEEADLCPCAEDAVVIRDCACLIKANFSYDDAEAIRQGDTP